MSQHATKLCALIVNHFFGELPSRVLEALLQSGRLPFPPLLRQTVLTPRQLRHGLAVLIQENLVLWYTSIVDGITSYEVDLDTCYNLVRSGKYLAIVEDRFQEPALAVIASLITHGHTSVGTLLQAKKASHVTPALKKPLRNGFTSKEADIAYPHTNGSLDILQDALCDLLTSGLAHAVHESHFRPSADNLIEAEMQAPNRPSALEARKKADLLVYKEGITRQLHEWKHGTEAEMVELSNLASSRKRKSGDGSAQAEKRPRLSTEFELTDGINLREDVFLRLNHKKFSVLERNEHLVNLAAANIGTVTSQLYAAALALLEKSQLECKNKAVDDDVATVEDGALSQDLPQFSTSELKMSILFSDLKSTDLADSLGFVADSKINMALYDHRKKRRRKTVGSTSGNDGDDVQYSSDENEEINGDDNENITDIESDPEDRVASEDYHPFDPNPRKRRRSHTPVPPKSPSSPLTQHLLLLAHHPFKFLHYHPATLSADERWSVDFHALSKQLVIDRLMQTITAKFGPLAARLVRILHQKGKVDEKNLTSLSLVNQKAQRKLLSEMNSEGFLELQEIPKDTARQPMKTIYLWFFDVERCRKRVLEMTYKTMCRLLQRIGVERAKVKETVEKSERVDVQGHEDEFLGEGEKEALAAWRAKEERLLGDLSRLDDLVAVLRDF